MLELCELINDPDSPKAGRHRELETAEIKKSEAAAQRAIDSIHSVSNPFTIPDKDKLYSLSSDAAASPEVERDVLRAECVGKTAKQDFIDNRFKESNLSFFDPVKRIKLLTMEKNNKMAKLTSSQGKVIKTHMTHCYGSSGILVNSSHNSKLFFCVCFSWSSTRNRETLHSSFLWSHNSAMIQ